MILIAHRGNLDGPNPKDENSPDYIKHAIKQEYQVEIDLRTTHDNKLYLGHDVAQYEIDLSFLVDNSFDLWIHCKDNGALTVCSDVLGLNYFWHDIDDYTLTSQGYVWAYPGKMPVNDFTVMVLPESHWDNLDIKNFGSYGICSDYVKNFII